MSRKRLALAVACAAAVLVGSVTIASGVTGTQSGPAAPDTRVAVGDSQVVEPASGQIGASVPLTLSAPAASDIVVSYYTEDGTASGGYSSPTDFNLFGTPSSPRSVTIKAGSTWQSISPSVFGDTNAEGSEDFFVRIASAVTIDGAAVPITDDNGRIEILEPLDPTGEPAMVVRDVAMYETDVATSTGQKAQFAVQFSKPLASDTTLTLSWVDGTAARGNFGTTADYRISSAGQILVPAGSTAVTKTVDFTVWGDTTPEADENLYLFATLPAGSNVVPLKNAGTFTILNDEGAGPLTTETTASTSSTSTFTAESTTTSIPTTTSAPTTSIPRNRVIATGVARIDNSNRVRVSSGPINVSNYQLITLGASFVPSANGACQTQSAQAFTIYSFVEFADSEGVARTARSQIATTVSTSGARFVESPPPFVELEFTQATSGPAGTICEIAWALWGSTYE